MGFRTEFFKGHWYEQGYVFKTCEEASAFGIHSGIIPYRVVPTDDPVNYAYQNGELKVFKELPAVTNWNDYINNISNGLP